MFSQSPNVGVHQCDAALFAFLVLSIQLRNFRRIADNSDVRKNFLPGHLSSAPTAAHPRHRSGRAQFLFHGASIGHLLKKGGNSRFLYRASEKRLDSQIAHNGGVPVVLATIRILQKPKYFKVYK